MEQINTDELISKLITGTYEEFFKNIILFLEIVSIRCILCTVHCIALYILYYMHNKLFSLY